MVSYWHGLRWLLRPYQFYASLPARTSWAALPGLGRFLITGDPEVVAEVNAHPDLVGGRAHRAMRAVLGEDHLIVLCGEEHRQRRRIVFPVLHQYADDALVVEATRAALPRGPVRLLDWARDLTLEVMVCALLGRPSPPVVEAARAFYRSFTHPLNLFWAPLRRDLGPWSPWGRLVRRRARLLELLERFQGAGLSAQVPTSELLALLMFGHETTAGALAWAFAHLRPEDGPRLADDAYASAFVDESLRLCPAVAQVTRVALRDTTVAGQRVPAGTTVMPSMWLSQHDPRAFPEPGRFCPMRSRDFPSYYPFGMGQRLCPGQAMALRQMRLILQTVVAHRQVRVAPGLLPVRQLFLVVPERGVPAMVTAWA